MLFPSFSIDIVVYIIYTQKPNSSSIIIDLTPLPHFNNLYDFNYLNLCKITILINNIAKVVIHGKKIKVVKSGTYLINYMLFSI